MVDRLPVVLRTDTTPARLQEMPTGDQFPKSVLANALIRTEHTGPLNWAWATYGGSANAVALTPAFTRTAYAVGDEFRFRASAANTGATTINVGGLGAKAAVTVTGAALPPGYIRSGVDTVCTYDGARFVVGREIEYGSNANGNYVKLADGTAICTFERFGYAAGVNTFALPLTLISGATASCSITPLEQWDKELGIYISGSSWVVNMSQARSNYMQLLAVGRWT